MFQIATDPSQHQMVIATGPWPDGTDFGPEFPIWDIEDDTQYDIALNNPVTYLNTATMTIVTEVPA